MKTTPHPSSPALGGIAFHWLWHAHTLKALQQRLRHERNEQLHAAAVASQSHATDQSAAAADEAEREVLFSALSVEGNALAEVESALERIRNGRYGICEETGRPISPERLRAVPWTRFTREAAARHERPRR